MTKFLVGINAAQALHTWQYADKTRLAHMGSSASLTMVQRKNAMPTERLLASTGPQRLRLWQQQCGATWLNLPSVSGLS